MEKMPPRDQVVGKPVGYFLVEDLRGWDQPRVGDATPRQEVLK